jgi:R3H-associated N-terminal domain
MNNPWAQPPLPSDWEVQPTYPKHAVPYYLAPLWDAEAFERSIERKMKGKKQGRRAGISPIEEAASNVPKEVRSKLKHARAAKGLLQDLEEEVRLFLQKWNDKERKSREDGFHDVDSEEEEIVFVGRNGQMYDSPTRDQPSEGLRRDKLVFDALANDRGASFG